MLDASDQERLREIEECLLADDPVFVARMRGQETVPGHRPFGLLVVAGVWLLWVAALLAGAMLGWPALAAGVAVLLAAAGITWWMHREKGCGPYVVG
jgi:Protein of unknown function (DUF3040)